MRIIMKLTPEQAMEQITTMHDGRPHCHEHRFIEMDQVEDDLVIVTCEAYGWAGPDETSDSIYQKWFTYHSAFLAYRENGEVKRLVVKQDGKQGNPVRLLNKDLLIDRAKAYRTIINEEPEEKKPYARACKVVDVFRDPLYRHFRSDLETPLNFRS